jgi:hypothetical protein
MKFWQVTSIFRDEKEIIESEFQKEEWKFYLSIYKNLELIIKHQQREFLDMQIDNILLKNICVRSKKNIYFSINDRTIYSYHNEDTNKKFSISEAIDLFAHDAIEEVFEKTSACVVGMRQNPPSGATV